MPDPAMPDLAMTQTTAPPPPQPADQDARWEAVRRRDPAAAFFYSVATTGVYCRPACPARLARRENVAFHATRAEAERAGFRPCKRCRPDLPPQADRRAATVAEACRLIAAAEEMPPLETLAATAGLSKFHFHRVFKEVTGVTPKAYAMAQRAARVREELHQGETVTSALYGAGFNASSRFYEQAPGRLGMAPSSFRAGGRGERIRFAVGQCSLGAVLVAATETGICAIQFADDPQALVEGLQARFPHAELVGGDPEFEATVAAVVGYVEAPERGFDLPLDVRGTAFQERVWRALRAIPPGTTVTYAELAARIGAPKAVRAVGSACGANPVAVAIPCHRVVRTGGDLSGYRWGVERKRALLAREAKA